MADNPKITALPTPSPAIRGYQSPKSRFLESDNNIVAHRKLLDSRELERGVEFALAHFTRAVCALANNQDLNAAGAQQAQAASFQMIQGAHNFLEVFYTLAERQQPAAKAPNPDKLDHNN